MAGYQTAECSSGFLQNGCILASCNTAYPYATLALTVDGSPELLFHLLQLQISSYVFLKEFKHLARVVGLMERCIKPSKKVRQQHNHNLSSSSSESTFTILPLGSSLDVAVSLKNNDDGGEDDQNQDSPDGNKNPATAMPRSLDTLRFACHFHKRASSRYCAAGCRYKTCEHAGWENIAGVKQHLQRQHIASVDSFACSRANGRNRCDLHLENGQTRSRTESEQYESINQAQWQLICRLVITDRCRDENIWFEIWAILFPETQAPAHPWHETRIQNLSRPSKMSIDLTESFPTRSEITHDHRAQTGSDPDQNALVETITEPNTPSLLSSGSQTHSITSVLASDSGGKPANTSLDSTTELIVASTSLETNCYRAIPQYVPPSLLELGDSLGDWSQFIADPFSDDSKVMKNIANYPNHDSTRFMTNLASENSTMSAISSDRGLEIDNGLLDSSQYLENRNVSAPFPEGEIAPYTTWDHSVEHHLVGANEKEKISERNVEPGYNDKQNMRSEDLDYLDPTSNTDLWTQSDSNGFESFEYWILRDALASDPDLFARSLSLFQAEWQRKNIPRSPGVVSYATTGDSTSETGAISSEANESSQKEPGRRLGKHNLPMRDPNEGDETDNDEPRRKRQKQTRDSNKPYDGPRFACPFYKKDPSKYCPSATAGGNYAGNKFAHCHDYGSIELHRLVSDHFKRHKIFDCAKCCEEFDDAEAALNHADVCPRAGQPPARAPRRDGIDKTRLDAIKTIMGNRGRKDREKWMQIFKVLFPSTPQPASPYCESIAVPLTSPAMESLIRTWEILIQTECRDNKMSIEKETFDHCVRLLRIALQTESTRADPSIFTAIPTPSSSSMVATTPFFANERSSQAATPFLPNRSLSRVSSRTRNMMSNTPTSSSNVSGPQNVGEPVILSNHHPNLSSTPLPRNERDRYTDDAFRANWDEAALSNESLQTGPQPQNVYIPPNHTSSLLAEESPGNFENTNPKLRNYQGSIPIEGNAYMPEQSSWQNPPAQGRQLVTTPMSALSTGNQIQGQLDVIHQLEILLAHGKYLLQTRRQSIPVESTGATSSQTPSRETLIGPPIIHERSSAGHNLSSNSPSPRVSGSRPISPTHEFAPPQQAQAQQQGHRNQPNMLHSSHVHTSQAHRREHHRLVSSQPILSTPYHAVENDIYTTAANQGFSNNSNNGLWQEAPPGYQLGVPNSMKRDMMSNNDELSRLLELPDPNFSLDDSAASMAFGSASNNNQNNSNNNGMDLRFGRRS